MLAQWADEQLDRREFPGVAEPLREFAGLTLT